MRFFKVITSVSSVVALLCSYGFANQHFSSSGSKNKTISREEPSPTNGVYTDYYYNNNSSTPFGTKTFSNATGPAVYNYAFQGDNGGSFNKTYSYAGNTSDSSSVSLDIPVFSTSEGDFGGYTMDSQGRIRTPGQTTSWSSTVTGPQGTTNDFTFETSYSTPYSDGSYPTERTVTATDQTTGQVYTNTAIYDPVTGTLSVTGYRGITANAYDPSWIQTSATTPQSFHSLYGSEGHNNENRSLTPYTTTVDFYNPNTGYTANRTDTKGVSIYDTYYLDDYNNSTITGPQNNTLQTERNIDDDSRTLSIDQNWW